MSNEMKLIGDLTQQMKSLTGVVRALSERVAVLEAQNAKRGAFTPPKSPYDPTNFKR